MNVVDTAALLAILLSSAWPTDRSKNLRNWQRGHWCTCAFSQYVGGLSSKSCRRVFLTQDRHCAAAYCLRITWGTLLIVDGLVLSLALGLGHGVVFGLALLLLLRGALLLQLSLVSHRALVFVNLHRRTLGTIEPFHDGRGNYTLSHFCSGIVVHWVSWRECTNDYLQHWLHAATWWELWRCEYLDISTDGVILGLALGLNTLQSSAMEPQLYYLQLSSPRIWSRTCPRSGPRTSRPARSCTGCRTRCCRPAHTPSHGAPG